MKKLLLATAAISLVGLFPTQAANFSTSVTVTQGTGTPFGTYQDGSSNNFAAVGITGTNSGGLHQAEVNSSNQLEVTTVPATPGAAAPGSSAPVVNAILSHGSVTSLGTSLVAKASAGDLAAFNCTAITGGAAGYCIAYNGTSAPSTGALTGSLVLDSCYFDTTPKGCNLSHIPNSIAFSSGIVILVTSAATPFTYTTGTDTAYIEADYY